MIYSNDLREFIKGWEDSDGPELEPHWDKIGKVWDIGWGHVLQKNEVRRSITLVEAEMLLDWDLQITDDGVNRLVTCYGLAQWQHDALVAFAYNVGLDEDHDGHAEGLGDSTLLRFVNAGGFDAAAEEFRKWNIAGGIVRTGLVNRRAAERAMFVYGDYSGRP